MAKNSKYINFYPVLDSSMINDLNIRIDYSFSYDVNNESYELNYEEESELISINSKDTNWNSDDYDLNIHIIVKLDNVSTLFGENGISPSNSKIGLCAEWYSSLDKIRKVIVNENFLTNTKSNVELSFDCIIPKNSISKFITLNLILYLAESSPFLESNEDFLNNQCGVILGFIDTKKIYLKGSGSLFPIKIESIQNGSLWDLNISFTDPEATQLSDGMCLILNSSHKDYDLVNPNSDKFCERLADEIVSNAITMLLCKLKEENYLEDLSSLYESGTIMEYAVYCKNVLNIDFSDCNTISNSVRKFMEGSNS